jgi:hypothetical protein
MRPGGRSIRRTPRKSFSANTRLSIGVQMVPFQEMVFVRIERLSAAGRGA